MDIQNNTITEIKVSNKLTITKDELHDLYVNQRKSTPLIAREFGLYMANCKDSKGNPMPDAPRIQRYLGKFGIRQRTQSEAMQNALEQGMAAHPTLGKSRTLAERLRQSSSLQEYYSSLSPSQKARKMKGLRKFWDDNSEGVKAVRAKIGASLRKAVAEGTYIEKEVCKMLSEAGMAVKPHARGIFGNTELEADILVNDRIIVEIDGPRHFRRFPNNQGTIEQLSVIIQTDNRKNAIVVSHPNAWIIRVLYPYHTELCYVHPLLQRVKLAIDTIQKITDTVSPQKRIVIIDMKKIIEGISCYDNEDYKQASKII